MHSNISSLLFPHSLRLLLTSTDQSNQGTNQYDTLSLSVSPTLSDTRMLLDIAMNYSVVIPRVNELQVGSIQKRLWCNVVIMK